MSYLPLIASVSILNALAAMSPGPDFVMVVRNSLNYSRKTGIYTAIGIAFGLALHIIYCAIGVAVIISQSAIIFTIIKLLGAAYLLYIGSKSILAKKSKLEIEQKNKKLQLSNIQAIKIGFITNALNPKASLFFLGIFSLVIVPETPFYIVFILSAIMILTAVVWFTLVSTFFTSKAIKEAFLRYEKTINIFFGLLLIALAVKLAFVAL